MRDDRAAIGIGTLIVFVGTVIVAAAAAGILVSTSSDIQPPDTTADMEIAQVVARRDSPHNPFLGDLDIYVLPRTGIDPHQMGIRVQSGGYDLHSPASDLQVRDVDGQPVTSLGAGQLAVVSVPLHDAGFVVGAGDAIAIRIDSGGAVLHEDVVVGPLGKAVVIPL